MELTVVGAGPAYSDDPGAVGASYLVENGGSALVLDLGQGAFSRLAATIEPSRVEAFLISHLHPDHFIDLVPLRHYLRYQFNPPRRGRVVAPAGIADRLDALHDEPGFSSAALDCEAVEAGAMRVAEFVIEVAHVTHHGASVAFRVSAAGSDRGLVYSGDVGVAEDLAPLIRPADVLLVEVSFGPADVPLGAQHLNASAVARLAAATRPSRVLLTHLQMGFDAAVTVAAVRSGFAAEVELVKPGFVTTI